MGPIFGNVIPQIAKSVEGLKYLDLDVQISRIDYSSVKFTNRVNDDDLTVGL